LDNSEIVIHIIERNSGFN